MQNIAKEILIKTRRKIFSQNLGNNATAFVGSGLDFSELREYYFGDDVRKINWKATAKEQKPYINLFTEERELNIVLAFMTSGSIYFGSKRTKHELMVEVLALLGYSALKNSDNLTTLFFSEKEEYFRKPTKNLSVLNQIVPQALEIDTLQKEVNYAKFCEYMLGRVRQKSIVFIIGDFSQEVDLSLLSAKHEIYAVVVRDRFEDDPKFFGELDLIDPDSFSESSFDFDKKMVEDYKKEIEHRDKKLHEHFLAHKIRHAKIYTDEDPFYKLNNLVR